MRASPGSGRHKVPQIDLAENEDLLTAAGTRISFIDFQAGGEATISGSFITSDGTPPHGEHDPFYHGIQ